MSLVCPGCPQNILRTNVVIWETRLVVVPLRGTTVVVLICARGNPDDPRYPQDVPECPWYVLAAPRTFYAPMWLSGKLSSPTTSRRHGASDAAVWSASRRWISREGTTLIHRVQSIANSTCLPMRSFLTLSCRGHDMLEVSREPHRSLLSGLIQTLPFSGQPRKPATLRFCGKSGGGNS